MENRTWENWITVEEFASKFKISKRRARQIIRNNFLNGFCVQALLIRYEGCFSYAKPIYKMVVQK